MVKGEVPKSLEKQQVTINLVCLPGVFCFTQAPPSLSLLVPGEEVLADFGGVPGVEKSCKTDHFETFFTTMSDL